jgi:L-iditol 2-dehydrogenase
VARLTQRGRVVLAEEPIPPADAGSGTELLRVTSVGLCGSDLHWFAEGGIGDARLGRPLVLGHEFAAVIEGGPRHGERVAVDPSLPCGRCATCLRGHRHLCPDVVFAGHGAQDGGLREFVRWPAHALHRLPDSVSDDAGALLEPLGVALHACDLAHLRLGSSVAVVGCGPIGLLLIACARAAGATSVLAVEPLEHRRAAALAAGADLAVHPDAGVAASHGGAEQRGEYEVVFEVSGAPSALRLAMEAARPAGRVVLVGIPDDDVTTFPASVARRKGLTILVSRRMKDGVYPRGIALVAQGVVDTSGLVTHTFPLDEVEAAFTAATARRGLKVVVRVAAPGD